MNRNPMVNNMDSNPMVSKGMHNNPMPEVYGQQMVNKSMDNNMGSKVLIDFIRKIAFLN